MFGKKKNDGVASEAASIAESASPATKTKKSKKQSLKGGPNVLVAHFEKAALLGIAGLAGFLAYSSFSKQGLQSSQSDPEALKKQASGLLTQVKENHWEAIAPEREKFASNDGKFQKDVEAARKPVEDGTFPKLKRLEPKTGPDVLEPRKDPTIFPAQDLVVRNVSGPLAIAVQNPKDNADSFTALPDADPKVGPGKPPKNTRNENTTSEDNPGSGPNNTAATKPKRRLKASYDLGFSGTGMNSVAGSGEGDMGMGPGMGGMGGMGGPGGGMGSGAGGPGGPGGGMGPGDGGVGGAAGAGGGLGEGPKGPTHRIGSTYVSFNAITAIIPHRKIYEEYHKTFINTGTFNPTRDVPEYLGLEVQRVDVTNAPYREIKDEEWKTILTNRDIANMPLDMYKTKDTKNPANAWASHYPSVKDRDKTRLGSPIPEVIDPRAVIRGLTGPIPPMLIRDYREFAKHPAIDWRWNAKFRRAAKKDNSDNTKGSEEDDVSFDNSNNAGAAGSMGMGGMGMGGMGDMGGEMGGMGSDMGMGGMGGMGEGYGDGEDGGGGMGGMGGGMGGMGGMGSGMGGMGGMGGGLSGAALLPENQPEFKMIRTYDFLQDADRDKVYRYRLRVVMRDPNYPENQDYSKHQFPTAHTQLPPPPNRELHHEVYDRVVKLRSTDDKMIEDNKAKNVYKARTMRQTDWSQSSAPVRFVRTNEAFVGDFDRGNLKIVIAQAYPRVHKLAGAVLAAEVSADRGAVLGVEVSKTKPLEIIAPTNKMVKKIENQALAPGQVVVDFRGGQPMAGSVGSVRDDPLNTSAEVMILRGDGSFIVGNSFDDQFLYRMYSFQDDIEAAKKTVPGSGGAGGPGGPGGMGGGGGGEGY